MKRSTILTLMMCALLAGGCASAPEHPVSATGQGKTLRADGYSRFDNSGNLKVKQRWLSAQQLAKLNAFRALADQLYYEPVGGGATVGTQVVRNEVYRVYLDTYLREARAADYRAVQDNLKTTLQLQLTPRFYQCMGGDEAQVGRCLQEDDKLAFTRLGYKRATSTTANLACGMADCSDQFYVAGFGKQPNAVDGVLLESGWYDLEWTVNTGARTIINYLLIQGFLNAL